MGTNSKEKYQKLVSEILRNRERAINEHLQEHPDSNEADENDDEDLGGTGAMNS